MTLAHKVDIARQYLEDSLRLYSHGRFLSALTLAGAAEEMLGCSLERSIPTGVGGVSLRPVTAFDKESAAIAAFDQQLVNIGAPDFTAKSLVEIRRELNAPRNSAKHFNDASQSTFDFDQQLEAGSMIIRAIRNYRIIFPDAPERYGCEVQDISVDQLNKLNPFGRTSAA
jgi:hypothetical protein